MGSWKGRTIWIGVTATLISALPAAADGVDVVAAADGLEAVAAEDGVEAIASDRTVGVVDPTWEPIVMEAAVVADTPARSCTDVEREFLATLVGSWEVEASRRGGEGVFEEFRAHSLIESGLEECGIIERFRSIGFAGFASQIGVLAAGPEGSFELARVDSEHGGFTVSSGRLSDDVLTLEWSRDLGSRILRTQFIMRRVSDSHFQMESYMSRADGPTWELTYRAEYRAAG